MRLSDIILGMSEQWTTINFNISCMEYWHTTIAIDLFGGLN